MTISKRRRSGTIAVTAAATAALVVWSASPAAASGGVCTAGDHCAGNVTFTSRGEILTIHDYAKDGHSVFAYLEQYKGGRWLHVTSGTNTKGYDAGPLVINTSIKDTRKVRYQVCLSEHGALFDCSKFFYDVA